MTISGQDIIGSINIFILDSDLNPNKNHILVSRLILIVDVMIKKLVKSWWDSISFEARLT